MPYTITRYFFDEAHRGRSKRAAEEKMNEAWGTEKGPDL